MTRNKAINKALAVVAIIVVVVGGEGARRPKIAERPETVAAVVL